MEKDRIIRVSDNLKKEIAFEIQNSDLKEACGFFSINHVETARDLSSAKVFFSTINSPMKHSEFCLLYTSPSPRDRTRSRMPSSA